MSRAIPLSDKLVTVYIDDKPVEVPENANLIQACEKVHKYVPHYCWHPSLSVPGNCRLCLLKVEGVPKMVAGCHTLVRPDMKIITDDDEVRDSREGMMEFLLANHPLDCPVCDRGGECQLQRFSMDYGAGETRFYGNERRRFKKPELDPLISIERNRCIHCTRCVRFTDEIAGDAVMGMFGRGDECYIGTFGDGPISNIYSGNVIDICPVGCLTNKPYRFKARPWELKQVPSVCTLCSSGCRVTHWMRAGEIYRTTPPTKKSDQFGKFMLDYDTTDFICNQGRFGNDFGRHEDRLLHFEIMDDEAEEPRQSGSPEAIKLTAEKLKAAAENGKVAVLVSPRLTNEELYAASVLTRKGLKTNSIDWRARLPHAESAKAYSEAMAIARGSVDEVEQYDVVVYLGAAGQKAVPIAALDIKEAAKREEIRLFVAGPRHDSFFTDQAEGSEHVMPADAPGFAEKLTKGEGDITAAMNEAGKILFVYEPGHLSGHGASAMVKAARTLQAHFGDKLDTLPLIPETNAQGAFFVGAQPDRTLAGGIDADGDAPSAAGLTGPEIIARAADGEFEALLIIGGADLLEHHPQPELVEKALESTPFVAVADLLPNIAADFATVLFPLANHYERTGTLLNVEGRLGVMTASERPQGSAIAPLDLLTKLGEELDVEMPAAKDGKADAQAVFQIIQTAAKEANALQGEAEKMPLNAAPVFAINQAIHPAFRGKMPALPSAYLRPREELNGFKPENDGPTIKGDGLTLLWDEVLQGRSATGDFASQQEDLLDPSDIELHPDTAAELGLGDRQAASLKVGDAEIEVRVRIKEGTAPKTVYASRNVLLFNTANGYSELPQVELKRVDGSEAPSRVKEAHDPKGSGMATGAVSKSGH